MRRTFEFEEIFSSSASLKGRYFFSLLSYREITGLTDGRYGPKSHTA